MASPQLGIRRERQVKQILESHGWWVCRAAGSLGDADLVALKEGPLVESLMIEVKATTAGPFAGFGPKARRELVDAAARAGAAPVLAHWPVRGRLVWLEPTAEDIALNRPWTRHVPWLPIWVRAEEQS